MQQEKTSHTICSGNVVGNLKYEREHGMRIKAKFSYVLLLVPVLVLAGVMFAKTAVDSGMVAAGPAVHKAEAATSAHADVLISDRTFIMKSIGVTKLSIKSGCPIVDCAAPPPGCFYQGPPATDSRGCPINCGTLVCDPNGIN